MRSEIWLSESDRKITPRLAPAGVVTHAGAQLRT